jgi:hypothetical protein
MLPGLIPRRSKITTEYGRTGYAQSRHSLDQYSGECRMLPWLCWRERWANSVTGTSTKGRLVTGDWIPPGA